MADKASPDRAIGEGYKLLGVGLQFAGGIILFMAGGFGLDRWLGTAPVLMLVGTLVGAVLSFVNLYAKLAIINQQERERREEEKRK